MVISNKSPKDFRLGWIGPLPNGLEQMAEINKGDPNQVLG